MHTFPGRHAQEYAQQLCGITLPGYHSSVEKNRQQQELRSKRIWWGKGKRRAQGQPISPHLWEVQEQGGVLPAWEGTEGILGSGNVLSLDLGVSYSACACVKFQWALHWIFVHSTGGMLYLNKFIVKHKTRMKSQKENQPAWLECILLCH